MSRVPKIVPTLLRVAVGVGLLVYLGASGTINWRALSGLGSNWRVTLGALLLLLLAVVLLAWRLSLLLRARGLHLPLGLAFRLTLIGSFFNSCLPGSTGGDVIKIYYAIAGNRGRRTEVATIVLLDRAMGMFALLILPLLIAPLFPEVVGSKPILRGLLLGAAAVALVMLVGFLVCFSSRIRNSRLLSWTFRKLPGGSYAEAIFETVHSYRYNVATLAGTIGMSLITHILTIGVMLLALRAIYPGTVAWKMCVLIPLGHLANTLPLTPGGLGVGEAAFGALFSMAGLKGGAEALLGWRLLTILVSLLGLYYYLRGQKHFVHIFEHPTPRAS